MEVQNASQKLISSFLTLTVRKILITLIFGLTTNLFIPSILNPSQIGIYNIATAILIFFTYFSEFGLAAAIIQKKEIKEEDLRTTFTIQEIITVIISTVLFIGAPTFAAFYGLDNDGMWLIRALAVGFFLTSLRVIPAVLLERELRFGPVVTVEIAETLTFCGLLIGLVMSGWGVESYSIAIIARGLVGVILIYILAPWKVGFAFSKESAKALFHFGIPFQLNSLLAMLKDRLVVLVVAKMVSPTGVGFITWSNNLAFQPLEIMNAMNQVTFPAFSRLQHDHSALKETLERSIFLTALLLYPLMFGIMAIAPSLVDHVVKRELHPALGMVYLFSITVFWASLSTPFTNLLNAIGKVTLTLKLMVMWTILEWSLTPLLVYKYGFVGDAWASAIISFSSIVPIIIIKKLIKVEILKNIWQQFFAGAIMSIGVFLYCHFLVSNFYQLLGAVFWGALIYSLIIYLLARAQIKDNFKLLLNRK